MNREHFFPRDEYYMQLALREAERALEHDDVPIGAIVVHEGEVLASACNERELRGDPTAHAEILALRDAGCAVLVVSEELEELFEISDRLHVIAKGRLSPSIDRARATVSLIGEWMSGLWVVQPLRETPTPTLPQRGREQEEGPQHA